jgi:uncharacterized membrane protein
MIKKITQLFVRFFFSIWSLFLHGLLAILPIVITVSLFYIFLEMIRKWLTPIACLQPPILRAIPYSEILLAILIIFAFGAILKLFIFKSLFHVLEATIFKLPLVKPIYSGVKQLTNAFSPTTQEHITFKQVVMLEFPCKNVYSLGFLTTQVSPSITPNQEEKFFNIFVPTTPNPTTGYFVIVSDRNFQITKLTRQEAMAMIISGGIIQPKQLL